MIRLIDLAPGDVVTIGTSKACYVGRVDPHPLWPRMSLVIWRMGTGGWSLDALSYAYVINGESETVGVDGPEAASRRAKALHNALMVALEVGR